MSQVIPEAAVEAKAIAWAGEREWWAHSEAWRNDRREDARLALEAIEASSPHVSSAWHDAVSSAWHDAVSRAYVDGALSADQANVMYNANPYRAAK